MGTRRRRNSIQNVTADLFRWLFFAGLALFAVSVGARAAETLELRPSFGAVVLDNAAAKFLPLYEYDHDLPLNADVSTGDSYANYSSYKIAFDSVNGERVPGVLYLPAGGGKKHPCVIFQHGYSNNKSMGGLFAATLAPEGYAVVAIDAEYHGDRREAGKDILSVDAAADEPAFRQSIIDLRRVIDYLETRDDIDTTRIGYVGVSMGSFLGAVFAGVDERLKTAILIVGGGGWEEFITASDVPPAVTIRRHYKKSGLPLSHFAGGMQSVEPLSFIGGFAPKPLLMLNCSNDTYVPKKNAEMLFDAAREPKYIEWFRCEGAIGHIPPVGKTQSLVKKWFAKQL